MLTISKALTMGQAKDYYQEDYSNAESNYYSEGGAIQGEWFGQLAEDWGLTGAVKQEQYERLVEGQDPHTGEQLIRHVGPYRYTNQYGEDVTTKGHRAGWDATFSAPKSVSLAALVGGDARIRDAHRKAVDTALRELERYIHAKMGNTNPSIRTGRMIAAKFEHDTARPDKKFNYAAPQLHTHTVIFNLTQLVGEKWRALDSTELFKSQRYATAIYRAVLAIELQKLGYEIKVDARTGAPEIVGFSKEYLEESSLRAKELRADAAEMKARLEAGGHIVRDGAGLRQAAASANKRSKKFDRAEMIERHQELDKKHGEAARKVVEAARKRGAIEHSPEEIMRRAQEASTFGVARVMDLEAVGDARDVVVHSLRRNMGLTTYEAVKEELSARKREGKLVGILREEHAPEVTTRRMLNLERRNIREVLDGKGKQGPIMEAEQAGEVIDRISSEWEIVLNNSQHEAVVQLLSSRDRIMGLQGRAGTGKTTVLSVLKTAAEEAGYTVRGFAPSTRAVKELSKSGIETTTLQKFTFSKRKENEGEGKTLYVLDESSLASSNLINKFFERIGPDDRIWLVGDDRQHQAIEAGSPFEQLQKNGMETVKLTEIVRQKDKELRQVVEKLAERKVRDAVKDLISQGRVTEIPDDENATRLRTMAADYCADREDTLIISPGNQERVFLNTLIREQLQERKVVAKENHRALIYVNRAEMSKSERTFAGAYNPGDVIRYNHKSKVYGTEIGDYGQVSSINRKENTLTVKLITSGRVITYDPKRLSGVSVYVEAERDFAVGDRIQFRAPLATEKVANGDFGVIREISDHRWQVELDDKRVINFDPETFRHIDHGYAVTSYSSQCATCSHVLINADTKESMQLLSQRMAYVSVSRARHEARIYTNSVEELGEALDRRVDKEMALEAVARSRLAPVQVASNNGDARNEAAEINQILSELEQETALDLDSDVAESLPELKYDRAILGAAIVAETRRICASLDADAARKYGRAYRLKVHDESLDQEREISEFDVRKRAFARGGRVASEREVATAERREIKDRFAEEDIARHSETLKAHNKAREELVRRLEEREARAVSADNHAGSRAQAIAEKYQAEGKQTPIPFISWETLNEIEDQAIKHGLTERIEKLEELRAALAQEHGHETRTDYEASRLGAQRLTAEVEYRARLERLTGFDESRHIQRYEIDGKKWSLADLDRDIERASDEAKFFGKYELHWGAKSRATAAALAESLSIIRKKVIERIKERRGDLVDQVEEARELAEVLDSAYAREAAARKNAGKDMPAPILSGAELKRIEANLPSIRDEVLVRQLPNLKLSADAKVNQSGRAVAREIIAQIGVREAAEELANFQLYGRRRAVLVESPDGSLSAHRPNDYRERSWLWEAKSERETRRAVEAALEREGRRLTANYEKALAYYRAAHEQLGAQDGERGMADLTPGEKMRVEIFAEKLSDPQERDLYLSLARQPSSLELQKESERAKAPDRQMARPGAAPVRRVKNATKLEVGPQEGVKTKAETKTTEDGRGKAHRAQKQRQAPRAVAQPAAQTKSPAPRSNKRPQRLRLERKSPRPPRAFKKVVMRYQSDEYRQFHQSKEKLVRVTRRDPCPICEKPDWCSVSADRAFAICMRVPAEREAKNGGFIHILDDSARDQARPVAIEVTQHQRADVGIRDEINRHLLAVLKLRPRDQNDLLKRGLDGAAIERNGYRSVPLPSELNDLMKKFEGKDLRGIPGFFRKDGTWRLNIGEWKDKNQTVHSFHQGYLIPVRDVGGEIAGFQIRRAKVSGDEPRYIWLSSNEKEDGTSSGAPVHYRNVEQARRTGQAILTEGALKADVSGHLLNDKHALIAVAGVGSFPEDFGRRLTSQIPELRQVVIAFDADAERKPEVRKALERLSGTLREAGLDVRELRWDEALGKGLDDFLLADPEHRVEVKEFLKESLSSLKRSEVSVTNPLKRDRARSQNESRPQNITL